MANKIIEKDRAKYSELLEEMRNQNSKELELLRTQLNVIQTKLTRYDEQQTEAYNVLWASLVELKLAADELWKEASPSNLIKFSRQLERTNNEVEKKSLYLEDDQYVAF